MSVPVRKGEAFGLYLLEALASGIPVVQPELGAFPEIICTSGGGITYEPNTQESLALALKEALFDSRRLGQMSANGREAITRHFHLHDKAAQMAIIYEQVISRKNAKTLS